MKWFVLTMLTSIAGSTLAQSEPVGRKNPPLTQQQAKPQAAKPIVPTKGNSLAPNSANIKFSMGMLEGDRFDPRYVGFKVAEVVESIEKITSLKKGEFETTADFEARKAAALKTKFLGDSTLEDTYAFVLAVPKVSLDGFGYEFNADASEVRLFVLPKERQLNGIGAPNYATNVPRSSGLDLFELERKVQLETTYEASNAYGAKVTVEKTIATQVGVAVNWLTFLNFKRDLIYSPPNRVPAAQVNLDAARAARELPALKALLVVKLLDPYIVYNFLSSRPTRDSPYDTQIQSKYLYGRAMGIVFYSGKTGEIFARLPDGFGVPEPKVEASPEGKPASQ